ncbi:hypothetical protein ABPG72_017085 [Tetrahymena utriculariae]
MSMGLNPIFNYVCNKFAKTKIVDSSSFEEYFKLKPEKDQFGYDVLSGLQSKLKFRQTLCFLLVLAQEMEQLKFPFHRTQELRSIIGSFLKLDISQLKNREYLLYQHSVLKQMEKIQTIPIVEKLDSNNNTQFQPQKSANPFGDLSSFMDTKKTEKKTHQISEKIIFERKNFKIQAWYQEKEEKEIQKQAQICKEIRSEKENLKAQRQYSKKEQEILKKPVLTAFNQSKGEKTNQQQKFPINQLFSSSPSFQSQENIINKLPSSNIGTEMISNNKPQSVIYKISKRQILEFDIPKKKPQINYFSSLTSHSEDNSNQSSATSNITRLQETIQPKQSTEVEEKVTVIMKQQMQQIDQKNLTSDEVLIKEENCQQEKEQPQQLKQVEKKITLKPYEIQITEQNQKGQDTQPQQLKQQHSTFTVTQVNPDEFLIKEEKHLNVNQVTQDEKKKKVQLKKNFPKSKLENPPPPYYKQPSRRTVENKNTHCSMLRWTLERNKWPHPRASLKMRAINNNKKQINQKRGGGGQRIKEWVLKARCGQFETHQHPFDRSKAFARSFFLFSTCIN